MFPAFSFGFLPNFLFLAFGAGFLSLNPCLAFSSKIVVGKDCKTLKQCLQIAKNGDTVVLPSGTWKGPVRIQTSIVFEGKGGIIDGQGKGKTLVVDAPKTIVRGITVQNSGHNLGGPDSCIYLTPKASHSLIENNVIRDCAFGLWVHEAPFVTIQKNKIWGRKNVTEADKGNGIHLFNTKNLVVRGNFVDSARDGIYVSAVGNSLIESNVVQNLRYGVHYMYSHYNVLKKNRSIHNVTGFALMQSHHMTIVDNHVEKNERHGILFRDAQYCTIRGNRVIENGEGFFFFSSTDNFITQNVLLRNQMGMRIWAGTKRNVISNNALIGNVRQIFYVGTEDLVFGDTKEVGNFWSDYTGWDQNKDNIGDRVYRLDSFTSHLLFQFPSSVLLLRSPILELLSHLEQKLPLLRVPTVLDKKPLMKWNLGK